MIDETDMEEVVQCHFCLQMGKRTYHFDYSHHCPECGAGIYWQCAPIEGSDLKECVQIAFNQESLRKMAWIFSHCDSATLEKIELMLKENNG